MIDQIITNPNSYTGILEDARSSEKHPQLDINRTCFAFKAIALRAGIVTDEFLVNSVKEGVKMMAILRRRRFANAYSQDLRVRALNLIKTGVSIAQVSRLLSISRPTLERWLEQLEATGSTVPKPRVPPPQPAKIPDGKKFKELVDFNNLKKIRDKSENAGGELLFLPSYAPDLNSIEHWWHKVKTAIRKELPKARI